MYKMNCKTIPAIFVSTAILLMSASCKMTKAPAVETGSGGANVELVEALKDIPVKGPSLGAPVRGLSTNAATEAVVEKGREIVPTLISALDHSSWTQTVWIVFCLRQLRATEANERILKLQQEVDDGRFTNQPHDLTLEAEIQGYLLLIGNQQSATNRITEHH